MNWKTITTYLGLVLLLGAGATMSGAKPDKSGPSDPCSTENLPVRLEILDVGFDGAISSQDAYEDGLNNVNARIQICSGTGDLTMSNLAGVGIRPGAQIYSGVGAPPYGDYLVGIHVKHLLGNFAAPPDADYTITTLMRVNVYENNKLTWRVFYHNPGADTYDSIYVVPEDDAWDPLVNTSESDTALVQVTYSASGRTWTITPIPVSLADEPVAVAGITDGGRRPALIGQFDLDFKLVVTLVTSN